MPLAASPARRGAVASVAVGLAFVIGAMAWVAAEFAGSLGLVVGVASFIVFVTIAGMIVRIAVDARPTMTVFDDAVVFDRPAMLRRPLRVPVDELLCALVGDAAQGAQQQAKQPFGPPYVQLDLERPNVGVVLRSARPMPEVIRVANGYVGDPYVPRPFGPMRRGVLARVDPPEVEAAAAALRRVVPVRALTAEELAAMAYPDDVVRRARGRALRFTGAVTAVTVVLMFTWSFRWVYVIVAMVGPMRNMSKTYRMSAGERGADGGAKAGPPSLR